jgi:hypothetical protein
MARQASHGGGRREAFADRQRAERGHLEDLRAARVKVPVLSKTKSVAPARASIACPRVTTRFERPSLPVATVRAMGVASESAHGHVTMSTEIATHGARAGSMESQRSPAATPQTRMKATNQREARAASRSQRGRSASAVSMSRAMAASAESAPTPVTRSTSALPAFTEPPKSIAPFARATSRLSPESNASFNKA